MTVHVAMLEVRWVGGDHARVVECIETAMEIAVQLIGGFDDHGIGPDVGEPDPEKLPDECASYERYLIQDPEAPKG